jgi:hypothetical protein
LKGDRKFNNCRILSYIRAHGSHRDMDEDGPQQVAQPDEEHAWQGIMGLNLSEIFDNYLEFRVPEPLLKLFKANDCKILMRWRNQFMKGEECENFTAS